jgi:hypothetical protein
MLGVSAIAGTAVLALGWPLNSVLARRAARIQKGALEAVDKRMGILAEMIVAVRIQFSVNVKRLTSLLFTRSNSSSSSHGSHTGSNAY